MRSKERAERLRQKLRQRIGVRQHPDLPGKAAAVRTKVLVQALGLAQDGARVLQQRSAGLRRRDTLAAARDQGDAERILHVADARRSRGKAQMGALGAMGNAAGLDDVTKQAEIGKIEPHNEPPSFVFDEV